MNTKAITLLLIILFVPGIIFGQRRLKYKDVYEVVLNGEREEAYAQLLAYQKQDPDFANTYFQLGLIADSWARKYDPLTEYDYVKTFIYDTKLYFGLAQLKLKDEKRRNRNLYENIDKFESGDFSVNDIHSFCGQKINSVEAYQKKITEIVGYFNKSSDSYNECLSIFKDINENYAKIKNIWMSNDPDLQTKLDLLQAKFDTAVTAFDNYRSSIRNFPVKNYNQRYALKNIYTYRLDGLEPANFLNNFVELWDYNSWVQQIRAVQNSGVDEIRTSVEQEHNRSQAVIDVLRKEEYYENPPKYSPDNSFYYKIERIDYESIITALFKMRETYADFLSHYRRPENTPESNEGFTLNQTSNYYYELVRKKLKFNRQTELFKNRITAGKINKHKAFLQEHYGDQNALQNYAERLSNSEKTYTDKAISKAQQKIRAIDQKPFPADLSHRGKNIFFIGSLKEARELLPNTYYVTDYAYTDDNFCNFTGFYHTAPDRKKAFFAQADTSGKVTALSKESQYQTGLTIQNFENGSIFIFSAENSEEPIKQLIGTADKNGKITNTKSLEYKHKITGLQFDDINNTASFTLQDDKNELYFSKYHTADHKILFETPLNIKGKAFDILKFQKNNYIFVNFSQATNMQGETINSKPAGKISDIALIITHDKGKISDKLFYRYPENTQGIKALKINSETINIFGEYITEQGQSQTEPGLYIIMDTNGKIIWQNRHN